MSMLKNFRPRQGLPDPKGDLSLSISERAITLANYEVQEVVMQSVNLKHRKYSWYIIYTFYNYHYNVHYYCNSCFVTSLYSGGSRWVSGVSTETPFQILKKPFSLQFIFNVHGLSYINYLNIQTTLLPDILRLL